jgi:hypothetical protein
MNPRVKKLKPLSNYRLQLTFSNGESAIYDCRPLLNFGIFQELQDVDYFSQARVEGGTVVWPHEQDICPDTLYQDSERQPTMQNQQTKLRRQPKQHPKRKQQFHKQPQ